MHAESLSFSENKTIDRFDGKHHLIAGIALSGLFESEDDLKNAFNETLAE